MLNHMVIKLGRWLAGQRKLIVILIGTNRVRSASAILTVHRSGLVAQPGQRCLDVENQTTVVYRPGAGRRARRPTCIRRRRSATTILFSGTDNCADCGTNRGALTSTLTTADKRANAGQPRSPP